KTNFCIEEIIEIVQIIKEVHEKERDYGEFDYKIATKLKIFPKRMNKEGFSEPVNSYMGGVDLYYSSLSDVQPRSAFEVSFQGLSKFGCVHLMKTGGLIDIGLIAVGGFSTPTPAGVLDEVYGDTKQEDIKKANIFKAQNVMYVSDDKINNACSCKEDVCSVVWKFR
ncbi:MAG: hypothetical protein IKW39_01970, partial [Alphaproteobacteria bacterium]|nr:hypothetical protein [Alphaproteobacteria bacterium]